MVMWFMDIGAACITIVENSTRPIVQVSRDFMVIKLQGMIIKKVNFYNNKIMILSQHKKCLRIK